MQEEEGRDEHKQGVEGYPLTQYKWGLRMRRRGRAQEDLVPRLVGAILAAGLTKERQQQQDPTNSPSAAAGQGCVPPCLPHFPFLWNM